MSSALRTGLHIALIATVSAVYAPSTNAGPAGKPTGVFSVAIASVTLADDCPSPVAAVPAATPAEQAPAERSIQLNPAARSTHAARRGQAPVAVSVASQEAPSGCEQTSMQLSLQAPTAAPVMVRVKKVELLNQAGARLAELPARAPTQWSSAAGSYRPWDQRVATTEMLAASYSLTPPDWSKISGGRFQPFRVRVTMVVGSEERTVERSTESSMQMLPPGAVT